jgi:hypothetical protein
MELSRDASTFCLQYADKSYFYQHEGMIVRAALTAIDNNKNVSRNQVIPIKNQT